MLESARWYIRTDDDVSAQFVLERLLRRHPATNAAQTALRIMDDRGWLDPEDVPGTLDAPAEIPIDPAEDSAAAPATNPADDPATQAEPAPEPPEADAPELEPLPVEGGRP